MLFSEAEQGVGAVAGRSHSLLRKSVSFSLFPLPPPRCRRALAEPPLHSVRVKRAVVSGQRHAGRVGGGSGAWAAGLLRLPNVGARTRADVDGRGRAALEKIK